MPGDRDRRLAWAAGVIRHAAQQLAKRKVGAPSIADIVAGGSYDDAASRLIHYLVDGAGPISSDAEALATAKALATYVRALRGKRRQEMNRSIAALFGE